MRKNLFYGLYLVITVVSILFLIELLATKILEKDSDNNHEDNDFSYLDPHLSYAEADLNNAKIVALNDRGHLFYKGFVIYGHLDIKEKLERPVILILGGSTSDPLRRNHSWPEFLANKMIKNNIPGTIINGATGGYTSSQELLKLIRDGLEFQPDIVISYGGLRDRTSISPLPHPMISTPYRVLLENISKKRTSIMPNTIRLIKGKSKEGKYKGYTLGMPSKKNSAEWWHQNMNIMQAMAVQFNFGFCAILQPFDFLAPKVVKDSLADLRKEQILLGKNTNYIFNFTNLLDKHKESTEDGVHATDFGNQIIADRTFNLIFTERQCYSRH